MVRKARTLAALAAVAAFGGGTLAVPAVAHNGDKGCTRSKQSTDTTRFETRQCVDTRADRVRADLRIRVRAELPTAQAAEAAKVKVRDRTREDARTGDMRIRVRTRHDRQVEDNVLRDEVRMRVEVRNADHPTVAIGAVVNGALTVTVSALVNGQSTVLRTLTLTVPAAS